MEICLVQWIIQKRTSTNNQAELKWEQVIVKKRRGNG
jgi:hypothetical protein